MRPGGAPGPQDQRARKGSPLALHRECPGGRAGTLPSLEPGTRRPNAIAKRRPDASGDQSSLTPALEAERDVIGLDVPRPAPSRTLSRAVQTYCAAPEYSTTSAIIAANCAKLIGLCRKRSPACRGSPLVLRRSGPADHHDGRCAAPRPYRLGNLEARQSRHEEVRDHGLVDERVKARQALAPVSRYVRLMSQQLDELREDVADQRLIHR